MFSFFKYKELNDQGKMEHENMISFICDKRLIKEAHKLVPANVFFSRITSDLSGHLYFRRRRCSPGCVPSRHAVLRQVRAWGSSENAVSERNVFPIFPGWRVSSPGVLWLVALVLPLGGQPLCDCSLQTLLLS